MRLIDADALKARIMEDAPVVRCKNCKNGGVDSTSYPHYWCTRHNKYVREDYFCADGERKGGE